jgi:glycosyltransferase involved in cell wall biosynthesis
VTAALVSVITPFYNSERYLADAIDSVLAQTYRPLELLLVDDASTDGSADIARRMVVAHDEVRLLSLSDNLGPAGARNVGLAEARGDFITFLDADDLMLRERVDVQLACLTEHPDLDAVLGAQTVTMEADAPPERVRRHQSRGPRSEFHIMSMMVRRRALDRVGGFDPSYRVAEDLDWLFRASAAHLEIGKIDAVLTRRRVHASNLSHRARDIQAAMIRSLRNRLLERRRDEVAQGHRHHPVL